MVLAPDSAQFSHFQIPKLNTIAFPLQAEVALRPATILKLTGDRAIDPERQYLAHGGHFQSVPFARELHPHVRHLLAQIEPALLAVRYQRLAKQVPLVGVSELRLMPDSAVFGIADVSAAVVARLALDPGVAELEMKDGIADFLVEQQHIMPAVPVADQNLLLGIHMPLFPAQLAGGRHGYPVPAFEVCRWKNVHPTRRIALQGARGFRPSDGETAEEICSDYDEGNH